MTSCIVFCIIILYCELLHHSLLNLLSFHTMVASMPATLSSPNGSHPDILLYILFSSTMYQCINVLFANHPFLSFPNPLLPSVHEACTRRGFPAETRRSTKFSLTLAHRLRRWPIRSPFNADTYFRRKNLASINVRFWRLKSMPAMKK